MQVNESLQLLHFSGTDLGGGFGAGAGLNLAIGHAGARRDGQGRQFLERFLGAGCFRLDTGRRPLRAAARQMQADQNRNFLSGRQSGGLVLVFGHRRARDHVAAGHRDARVRSPGVERPRNHYRGDGVLKDQLLLIVGFENHRIFVEALDPAGKFHATHQVDREERFVLARIV